MNCRHLWVVVGSALTRVVALGAGFGIASENRELERMADSWTGGTGVIYYTGGDVGVGTSTPTWQLHSVWSGTSEGAVYGQSTATTGTVYGVQGRAAAASGRGVYGIATHSSGSTVGVLGESSSTSGRGVRGYSTATSGTAMGVLGESLSPDGFGLLGSGAATSGTAVGVRGETHSAGGIGVIGVGSTSGATDTYWGVEGSVDGGLCRGVFGQANHTSGANYGVFGLSRSTAGIGVYGENIATSGNPLGVVGAVTVANGRGVLGLNTAAGSAVAIQGEASGSTAIGVAGLATSTASGTQAAGVYGLSGTSLGIGAYGVASHTSGVNYGVLGQTASATNGYGVYSIGRFAATGTKNFQIDHPLDPEHKFLNHFSAEGPEPYLIYRGSVTLDALGEAWVKLPEYFQAINRDHQYQLTPVGAPGMLYVADEIQDGMFRIAGGTPGGKVSWTVTGVRNDRFVQANPLPTEPSKSREQAGRYLMPELLGKGPEEAIFCDGGARASAMPSKASE